MMRFWSLKKRIYLGILAPVIISIIGLTTYLNQLRINDNLRHQQSSAHIHSLRLARLLSPLIETGQLALIDQLLTQVLQEPAITGVTIFDNSKSISYQLGDSYNKNFTHGLTTDEVLQQNAQHWYFYTPIKQRINPDNRHGWLLLSYSKNAATLVNYHLMIFTILLTISCCALPVFIAIRSTRWIDQNLIALTSATTRIKDGDYTQPITMQVGGALGRLVASTNAMVYAIRASMEEFQQNIQQSDEDLKETLDTIELQNVELDNSRKEAEKSSKIKSEFLANISHEIRTPLSAIIGFANLLYKSQVNEQQSDYIQTIHKSSENLLSIINNVLDFSKIEAGKLVLTPISLNLREVLEEVLSMLAPLAHDKQLELIQLIYSDVPVHIIADPLRVKQILTNLVSNAIKFTARGSITVRVELAEEKQTHKDLEDELEIKISVTDTGIGLSNSQQKTLFQAFSQGDTTTTRNFGGTGLGLVISQSLVEQMGGTIDLDSTQGRGSTFWFTLLTSLAHGGHSGVYFDQLQQCNVLYFEPHPTTRLATNHLLTEWGVSHTSTGDMEILCHELKQNKHPYHCLMLGLGQNNPSSEDSVDLIRRLNNLHPLPIVALSNSSDVNLHDRLTNSGATASLTKPLRSKQLYNALLRATSKEQPATTTSTLPPETSSQHFSQSRYRILAVDDNFANLKLIRTLLEQLGLQVTIAQSGVQAISLCVQNHFDLVFMDIQMPDMDGLETAMRIRHNTDNARHIPIVALSAHVLEEEKQLLMDAGMDDYVTKPIDESSLARVLTRWLAPNSGTSRESNNTTIDHQLALRLAGGKKEIAEEIFSGFISSLDADRSAINAAAQQNNWSLAQQTLHHLHGLCHYAGVPALQQQVQVFETALKRQQHDLYQQYLTHFNREVQKVLDLNLAQQVTN